MPLPYVAKVAKRQGRDLASVESDWARALSIVAAEYGDIPDGKKYALATKIFKNIAKGRAKNEMTMSGSTGGFVAGSAPVVVAGTGKEVVDPRRGKGRPRQRAKLKEDMPFSNLVTFLPDGVEVMVQNGSGYEAPDTGDIPEKSEWQEAGYRAAGSKVRGEPVGIAEIMGKKHVVYRDAKAKKLRALPLFSKKESCEQPGLHESVINERACRGLICPKCQSKDTYSRRAHEDTSMECVEHRCRSCRYSVESDDKSNPQFETYAYDDGEPEEDPIIARLLRSLSRRSPEVTESVPQSLRQTLSAIRKLT